MAHQMRYLSPDNIEMLKQGNEIIQKRYLKVNNTKHWTKRFGLATWILGWGIYKNAHYIMTIKKNIQNLYDQNVLQKKPDNWVDSLFECDLWTCLHQQASDQWVEHTGSHFKQNNDGSNWRDKID